jgi:hypothetical protein
MKPLCGSKRGLWALLTVAAAAATSTVFGQDGAVSLEPQCARFEPAQNASLQLRWTLLSSGIGGPYMRIAHTTAALTAPPRVLIIGGIAYESAQPVVVNTTIVYDPSTDVFRLPVDQIASSVTPISADDVFTSPASRVDHASAVAGPNVVLVFGGQNAAFLDDLWRLCISSDSTRATWDQFVIPTVDVASRDATPVARIGHSLAVVFENASFTGAIVYGGLSESYEDAGNQLSLALVPRPTVQGACSDRSPRVYWRTLRVGTTLQPDARAYHAASPVSRIFTPSQTIVCMFLYGGRSTRTNLIYEDVWRLCPSSPTSVSTAIEAQSFAWEQLSPIGSRGPGPRYGAAIAFIDEGKVSIAGGSYAFPNDFLSDLWEFNINATQWLSLQFDAAFSPPRRGHSITLLGDRLFLFGGRDRYSVVAQRLQVTTYAAPYCKAGRKITLCDATSTYVCIPCPAGYYLEAGTRNCLACAAGSYAAEGAAVCTKCPSGTFNPLPAQTRIAACVPCPSGSFSSVEGATAMTVCAACEAGTFAASTGTSRCTSCPAGSFSNANASSCSPCGVGQWSATAAAQCSKCSAGSFNPRNGSALCYPCPMGFYSDQGAATCSPCPINTFSAGVSAAGVSGCVSCPALMYTAGDTGCASCRLCAPGSSLTSDSAASCQPCAKGSYSTSGACLPCPLHLYSNATFGATGCVSCPPGTLTAATGSISSSDCRACSSSTQVFDGQSCVECSPGMSLLVDTVPSCEACIPGTYTASPTDASSRLGCLSCPTMAVAPSPSATLCGACPDDSYAMASWRSCISCAPSFLAVCPVGRNGLICSGNGVCGLRACTCASSWIGGDCSTPAGASVVSATAAVLYFPVNQTFVVRTRCSSPASTFEIRIKRAGSLVGELQARVLVKASNTNTSSLPSATFPAVVSLASGVGETKLTLSMTAFSSSTIGSNCRLLTLELVDVSLPSSSSSSMVSSDPADRMMSLYFDELNGPSGGTGSSQPRSLTAPYALVTAVTGTNAASAVLDRAVATKLVLQPPSSLSLRNLPLNIRIAIDSTGTESRGMSDLLPAMVGVIQAAYSSSAAIRLGMLNPDSNTSSNIYQSPVPLYAAAKRAVAAGTAPAAVTWQWLTDRIKATNTTQWRQEDGALRRFIVALLSGGSPPSGDPAVLATTLRQHAVFAFVVLAPGQTYATAVPSDVMQIVSLANSVNEMPQKLTAALQRRDASTSPSPLVATVLTDVDRLVQTGSTPSVTVGASGLPAMELTLNPMPAALSESTVQIAVPGLAFILVTLREPGASCYPVSSPEALLPMEEEPLGGWIGAWHLLSDAQWRRQWKLLEVVADGSASPSLSVQSHRYNDSSLYRTTRTSVLALTSIGGTRRWMLERVFDGALVAPGLDLIAKAYARHTAPLWEGISCALSLALVPTDANVSATKVQRLFTTRPDWTYVQLSSTVSFEVALMRLRLDCNASQAIDTVEWASLGLFPDPQIACLCPRGFFYDAGTCVRCPAGSYCVAGIKRECPLGFFSFGKADHCEKCRDGWMCINGLVRLCEAGTYASADSSCAVCPSGSACRNGMKTICPTGTFSLARSSDCQLCPPGTISITEGYVPVALKFLVSLRMISVVSLDLVLAARLRARCVHWDRHPTMLATTACLVSLEKPRPIEASIRVCLVRPHYSHHVRSLKSVWQHERVAGSKANVSM